MHPDIVTMLFEEWPCSARAQYRFARLAHTPVRCSSCWMKRMCGGRLAQQHPCSSFLMWLFIPLHTPSQKFNFNIKYLYSFALCVPSIHNYTASSSWMQSKRAKPTFFLVCLFFICFFWSSGDYPAHPSIICARISRPFTCRRSSGMLQLLHSKRERSLFFSFSDMDNIPSAGERAYQEASVKGRER